MAQIGLEFGQDGGNGSRKRRSDEMKEQFIKFHRKNPQVWKYVKIVIFMAMNEKGYDKWGIGGVMEIVRWESPVTTESPTRLKISNNHRAWYARMFIACFPEHKGFLSCHKQPSEKRPASGKDEGIVLPDPDDPTKNENLMNELRELGETEE